MRSDYGMCVELLAVIVFHSTFPDAEIEKEKHVIYDELNLYKDSPADRIYDEFEDMVLRTPRWDTTSWAARPR